nr:hypothetical protein CFP56_38337 [Quercus suber]
MTMAMIGVASPMPLEPPTAMIRSEWRSDRNDDGNERRPMIGVTMARPMIRSKWRSNRSDDGETDDPIEVAIESE